MDSVFAKAIAERKIVEDRRWASRYRLAVEADRATREARQPAAAPPAGQLRSLASAARTRVPVQRARLADRVLAIIDSTLRALGEAAMFDGMM